MTRTLLQPPGFSPGRCGARPYSGTSQHLSLSQKVRFQDPRQEGDTEAADADWAGRVQSCTHRETCSAGVNSLGLGVGAVCSGLAAVSLWVQEAECRDMCNRLSHKDPLAL